MTTDKVVEIIKASFGWGVLLLLAWLAWHIVHGEVTQANSYGLDAITGGLISLAGGYGQWAFAQKVHVVSPESVERSKSLPLPPPPSVPPVTRQ